MLAVQRRSTFLGHSTLAREREPAARICTVHQSHHLTTITTCVLDILSFFQMSSHVCNPHQINSQVTKPKDRAILNRLVEIMVSLELRLVQDKAEDGQLVYLLDPYVEP